MKKSLESLKEKFGKFAVQKNEIKYLRGGSTFVTNGIDCNREPWSRECRPQGIDYGDNTDNVAFLCTRQAPSGTLEQEHFGNLAAGEAWTHEKDNIGWISRSCIWS